MYFNVIGALLWVGLIIPAGYCFGQMEVVKNNFELVVFGIIGFSLLPIVWEFARAKFRSRQAAEAE
jgi:membrane-associated protein